MKSSKNNKHSLINKIPLTKIRVYVARLIYFILKLLCLKKQRLIRRNGINYKIDLSEGIDLSLFLFGDFQKYIYDNQILRLSKDSVVFDVGANVGDMTLKFAELVPQGKVYAFEPTHYAFSKLKQNLSLNPALCKSVIPVQCFISYRTEKNPDIKAYASWKINLPAKGEIHPVHCGTLKSTEGISSITIDAFCRENNIKNIDFIKIDTYGHEWNVLKGAEQMIKQCRPKIIFEIDFSLMKENNTDFHNFYNFFSSLNYKFFNSKNKKHIDINNYFNRIPQKTAINILAIPFEKSDELKKMLRE